MLDGSVIPQCKPRHRYQEFIGFLHHLEQQVPARLELQMSERAVEDQNDVLVLKPPLKWQAASAGCYHICALCGPITDIAVLLSRFAEHSLLPSAFRRIGLD